jgi:hypothetical protein
VGVEGGSGGNGAFKVVSVEMGPTTEEIMGTMRFDVWEDIASAVEELAVSIDLHQLAQRRTGPLIRILIGDA